MCESREPKITLRRLASQDLARIERWPAYPDEFKDLDYALREGGWLAEYSDKQAACFVADEGSTPIAFSILANSAAREAEFRMALRADKIGQGLGRAVACATLARGFTELALTRIHLIVRTNNLRAIRLYQSLGFAKRGECSKTYNGRATHFLVMDLSETAP